MEFYNLDAILSVGYRVNSASATQFRIWASKILKEYIIKGFAMDDERLKNGRYFEKIIFRNFWKESALSVPASEESICRLLTYSRNAVLIIIKILKRQKNFSRRYRINFILLSQAKPLPRLFMKKPTQGKKKWGFCLGKTRPKAEF